jgi:hypothetical protein
MAGFRIDERRGLDYLLRMFEATEVLGIARAAQGFKNKY